MQVSHFSLRVTARDILSKRTAYLIYPTYAILQALRLFVLRASQVSAVLPIQESQVVE